MRPGFSANISLTTRGNKQSVDHQVRKPVQGRLYYSDAPARFPRTETKSPAVSDAILGAAHGDFSMSSARTRLLRISTLARDIDQPADVKQGRGRKIPSQGFAPGRANSGTRRFVFAPARQIPGQPHDVLGASARFREQALMMRFSAVPTWPAMSGWIFALFIAAGLARRTTRSSVREPLPHAVGKAARFRPVGWLQDAHRDRVLQDGDTDPIAPDRAAAPTSKFDAVHHCIGTFAGSKSEGVAHTVPLPTFRRAGAACPGYSRHGPKHLPNEGPQSARRSGLL